MPRRALPSVSSTPVTTSLAGESPSFLPDASAESSYATNLRILRTHWKWAAFSQFFYTFSTLFSMPDVKLSDIEDDLARGTSLYLPRVMHRLLYTLTQDRKINIDNWQMALRRQYLKRDPDANPLGPDPNLNLRLKSEEVRTSVANTRASSILPPVTREGTTAPDASTPAQAEPVESTEPKPENGDTAPGAVETPAPNGDVKEEPSESKDWFDLPLLTRLESLHLLTEWQFQNPTRLRSIMKVPDDETVNWRVEPIGYDAKTNAYWLIGPDRLWIQRALPKPPRPPKRKRQPAAKPKAKPRAKLEVIEEEESAAEDDLPPPPAAKRTRTTRGAAKATSSQTVQATQTTNSRARAAKLQANKKLDMQYKELEAFQREAAAAAQKSPAKGRRGATGSVTPAPAPRPILGTRASARLRRGQLNDEDEWQQVPEEWLHETATPSQDNVRTSSRKSVAEAKGKGKRKAEDVDDMDVDEPEAEPEAEMKENGVAEDSMSELTELSDEPEPELGVNGTIEDAKEELELEEPQARQKKSKGKGKARVIKGKAKRTAKDEGFVPPTVNGKVEEPVVKEIIEEPPAPPLPADFAEWEAIAITLQEWEQVAEPFKNATHYLEKALYKVLSQVIVPAVTSELREIERQRRLEEAIVHRKRSSRIATKESEKEQARLLAKQKAEEEEKLARARRQEARAKKEEAEREKREKAREQRRLEREERERRAREEEEAAEKKSNTTTPEAPPPPAPTARATKNATKSHAATKGQSNVKSQSRAQATTSKAATAQDAADWILDCEICGKYGQNLDGNLDLVSCGTCSRWQHIQCHDHADMRVGRPRRNWQRQQFTCARCSRARADQHQAAPGRPTTATLYPYQAQPSQPPRTGYWQDDGPVHLHHSPQYASSSQQLAPQPLPTSDLRHSAYPNHTTTHPSVAGRASPSYGTTIPLSQPQYSAARSPAPVPVGSSGYPYTQYGASTNGGYSRQAYGSSSHYPTSDYRTSQSSVPESWSSHTAGYPAQAQSAAWSRPEMANYSSSRSTVQGYPQTAYPSHPHPQSIPLNGQDVPPMVSSNHVSYQGHPV